MLKYNSKLKDKARLLRAEMTDSERVLWARLRRKQVHSVQFYRQKPIGNHIVDFYAPKAKLVVEVDGSQHMDGEQTAADSQRDAYLATQGLQLLRFDNLQVLREIEGVMEVIGWAVLESLEEIPLTPFCERGGSENLCEGGDWRNPANPAEGGRVAKTNRSFHL